VLHRILQRAACGFRLPLKVTFSDTEGRELIHEALDFSGEGVPQALTSTVMQRYHVNVAIKRELGSKLGKLPQQ